MTNRPAATNSKSLPSPPMVLLAGVIADSDAPETFQSQPVGRSNALFVLVSDEFV